MVGGADFVAYEGFELIPNAVNEMESPEKTLPASLDSYSGSITVNPTSPKSGLFANVDRLNSH